MKWKILFGLLFCAVLVGLVNFLAQYLLVWLVLAFVVFCAGWFFLTKSKRWVVGKKQNLDLWYAAKKQQLGSIFN